MKAMKNNGLTLAVLLFTILLFSCQNENSGRTDSADSASASSEENHPGFETVSLNKKWNNCDDYPAKGCIDVSIQYPDFNNEHSMALREAVEDQVMDFVADFLSVEQPVQEKELKPYIEKSLQAKEEEFSESAEDYPPVLELEISFEPIYQNNAITSIHSTYTAYEGGAHPNSGAGYHIFRNDNGRQLDQNIIAKDMALKQMMLSELKQRAGQPDKDISEIGYLVNDLEFAVSNNIGVSEDSLFITYSPYEIAPYSMGFQNFSFPKNEVSEYLSRDFLEMWNSSQ